LHEQGARHAGRPAGGRFSSSAANAAKARNIEASRLSTSRAVHDVSSHVDTSTPQTGPPIPV
jgi:hypothetical protein